MEIVIRIDTNNPPSAERLRKDAAFILHIANDVPGFLSLGEEALTQNASQVFGGQALATPAPPAPTLVTQTPPPPPGIPAAPAATRVPPAPTNRGDGSATDLLRPTSGVELDKDGMPWDARIHSAKKTKIANGTWKTLRGVDKALLASVQAEYQGAAPSTPPAPPVPPAPTATNAAPATPPAPPAPPAPTGTPDAPAVPAAAAMQTAIINGVNEGKIQFADVNTQCMVMGYGNIGEVNRAGQMESLYNHFKPLLG